MDITACPDCDLLQRIPLLAPGDRARCRRCGHILARELRDPLDRPLALTITATIVLIMANTSPLMSLSAVGRTASTTIIGGAMEMWQTGEPLTALAVAFCAVIAPGLYLLFMLIVLFGARQTPAPRWVGEMLRAARSVQPWSMNEVMLLGILVALIKIAELASVEPGIGLFSVGALVVLIPAIMVNFDPRQIWQRVVWDDGKPPGGLAAGDATATQEAHWRQAR